MKSVFLFLLCCLSLSTISAQINGNGNVQTETRYIDNIDQVLININGEVEVICSAKTSKIELTYDENILPYVRTEKRNGVLEIDQKEWIEGTQSVKIKIYTDRLVSLENDSWSKVRVVNIDQEKLKVKSSLSTIYLSGQVENLKLKTKHSDINAMDLKAKRAEVKVTGDGRIFVYATESLMAKNSETGEIRYKGNPTKLTGTVKPGERYADREPIDTRFIQLKVRNNGLKTIQAYVKGPKPDGSYFSYGLPFRPLTTRAENWSIGTKLYKVNALGVRKLIYEVKAEDEGQVITLKG